MRDSWLAIVWYLVLFISIIAYSVGDGFDLGVGLIYPFVREERGKQVLLNSIGPFWDGNEVWLIVIFGGLLAGFPEVYGQLLSVFYMPVWLLVLGLIFRGAAIEFRNKLSSHVWKIIWDICFSFAGLVITFLMGAFLGNILLGFPSIDREFVSEVMFCRLYPILIGVFGLIVFAIQGGTYLLLKTESDIHSILRNILKFCFCSFIFAYIFVFVSAFLFFPSIVNNFLKTPYLFMIPILNAVVFFLLIHFFIKKHYGKTFFCSCMNVVLLIITALCSLFPYLLRSLDGSFGLTLFNASVDRKTLEVLLIILVIGLPFVLFYNIFVYRMFRGKIGDSSDY